MITVVRNFKTGFDLEFPLNAIDTGFFILPEIQILGAGLKNLHFPNPNFVTRALVVLWFSSWAMSNLEAVISKCLKSAITEIIA